ncbi:GDSL-type esterase/lipase family protein [Pseudotenacibaculum sp. MALMAid0570]|uniref:SGNH/GDSL hydrolase family protein n=1 Tax=Pseudotenacibaculum sp. MALMAid0570 TaxID=3143938 RepID=UPI0032DF1AD4
MREKKIQKLFLLLLVTIIFFLILIILSSCQRDDNNIITRDSITLKIMPIGDSRVAGSNSLQGFQSYRYDLWKLLIHEEIDFDFIGPKTDLTSQPNYQNQSFDPHHAGYGGFTSANILSYFTQIIDPHNVPDIVLLGIGGNDLLLNVDVNQIIQNINLIVDFIQVMNPDVIIIIEQIAPGKSDIMTNSLWQVLNELNSKVINLTNEQTTQNSTVITVDMAKDWQDFYLFDDVHYSQDGALLVAERYFQAILSLNN